MTFQPDWREQQQSQKSQSSLAQDRGGCLTLWLVVSVGFSVLSLSLILANVLLPWLDSLQGMPLTTFGAIFLVIANLYCLWAIWRWKRWGVYGLIVTFIASLIVELMIGTATDADFIAPFIQIGILAFLIKDKWEAFE
ncbi:MAG: hypothetical protein K8L99_34630 [Anaerolineae bacterium]|nr:hypothetical protein [Anaerolineae bacterium]